MEYSSRNPQELIEIEEASDEDADFGGTSMPLRGGSEAKLMPSSSDGLAVVNE